MDKVYYFSRDGKPLWSFTVKDWVNSAAISSDGQYVAIGSEWIYYFSGDMRI